MRNDAGKKFVRVYDRYVKKIYRFVYLKVSSQEIAEDITSEVFLRVWKRYRKQELDNIKDPGSFLYKTAKNLLVDYYRKRTKIAVMSLEDKKEIPDAGQQIDKKEIVRQDIEKISNAISQLKDEHQDLIIWYYIEEVPISEIAKITNKTENAVRVAIHRAMNKLKEILEATM